MLVKPKHDLSKDEFDDYVKKFDHEFENLSMVRDRRDVIAETNRALTDEIRSTTTVQDKTTIH